MRASDPTRSLRMERASSLPSITSTPSVNSTASRRSCSDTSTSSVRVRTRRQNTRPGRFSLHRGASRYAPENTLPAFEKAIRLGADFIVGFPGESEAMFEETVSNVERVGFSYGHVFRYSKRPSTPAAELPGQLDEKEKNHRSALLREALRGCRAGFIRTCMGAAHRIIVETENPVVGIASNYLRIEIPGVVCKRNQWSEVLLTHDSDQSGRCLGALSA